MTTPKQKPTELDGISFADAVHVVKAAIAVEEKRLEAIAEASDNDPVMLEGETSEGYQVQMMIYPKKLAQIMLDYDYPTFKILEEDAPTAMWKDMARFVGLANVYSVDL